MSTTKRVWIEGDPAFEDVRRQVADESGAYAKDFTHRLANTRFEIAQNGRRRRNPWWRFAVARAISETGTKYIQINGGLFFRTRAERDQVEKLAAGYAVQGIGMLGAALPGSPEGCRALRFETSLRGKNTTVAAELEKAKRENRDCPNCGYPMRIRVARKGAREGTNFLGCRFYPSCDGTRPLPSRHSSAMGSKASSSQAK